jgi:hypothetical protein
MKKLLAVAALALVTAPAFAAIQYDFIQKNSSDDTSTPSSDLSGRTTIDGMNSRVDFLGGTIYPPGTYVISNDGSRRLFYIDPSKRWYTEVNAASVATKLGAAPIKIQNQKSNFEKRDDTMVIAGLEADHYRVTLTYDITVTMKGIPLTQHVRTEIDTWATPKYADVLASSVANVERTGNAELDKLLDAETSKIRGLPLRQTVTTRTLFDLPTTSRSELKVPATRTIIRETWVTKIHETAAEPSLFRIPSGYRRADTPETPRTATETLKFDPPTQ